MKKVNIVITLITIFSAHCVAKKIEVINPLSTKLTCSGSSLILEIENLSNYTIPLDGRAVGIENDFRWNPYVITDINTYKTNFEVDGANLYPPKIEDIDKVYSGDYLLNFVPFEKVEIQLDIWSEYVIDNDKTYVVSLFSQFHKVKVEENVFYINLNSAPIKLNKNGCIGSY